MTRVVGYLALALAGATGAGCTHETHAVVNDQLREQAVLVNPATLKFTTLPNAQACAKTAVLRGDPATGPSVLLQKLSAGCKIPWHWHTPAEEVMVASGAGTLEMEGGTPMHLQPGAYALLPGHHVHRASCTSACTVFVSSDGVFDIHYVDDLGAEIPAEDALRAAPPPAHRRKAH